TQRDASLAVSHVAVFGLKTISHAIVATMTLTIRVLYFASAHDAVGGLKEEQVKFDVDEGQQLDLWKLVAELETRHPKLKMVLGYSAISINSEIVEDAKLATVKDKDEVAIIPPVSGG
ncbi:hypothetical protein EV182_004659, partial [Spiromyces aspiralis]